MVRLSLHRHVPWLLEAGLIASGVVAGTMSGCGRSLLGEEDTDGTDGSTSQGGSDPSGSPTSMTDPTSPTDPSSVTLTTNPTDPTDPTGPFPMPGPPQLIDARVLDASVVELFFSEPIAPIGSIDPKKFRLSAAFDNAYYAYGTWYSDLGRWNGNEVCHEYCYGDECYEWCYTPPGPNVQVIAVTNSSYADRVLLTLDQPITANVCRQLEQRLDNGADVAALFLHYSNNGQGIVDTDGESLDAIAEHWVLLTNQYYSYQQGAFPFMTPFVPIPCPF
jgi:hypothetical protein